MKINLLLISAVLGLLVLPASSSLTAQWQDVSPHWVGCAAGVASVAVYIKFVIVATQTWLCMAKLGAPQIFLPIAGEVFFWSCIEYHLLGLLNNCSAIVKQIIQNSENGQTAPATFSLSSSLQ